MTDPSQDGVVIEQRPGAGTQVDEGSQVVIVIGVLGAGRHAGRPAARHALTAPPGCYFNSESSCTSALPSSGSALIQSR